jgi:hypothetical protein
MSAFSDYLERKILDAVLRNTSFSAPSSIYLALMTNSTADDGSGIEVAGGSYARQTLTSGFPAASGTSGSVSNSSNITFPTASANWGTVTNIYLMDANNQKSFANTDINTGTDVITITTHGFTTADQVSISRSGGSGTFPTGITEGAVYFVRNASSNTVTLHPTAADATGNTNIVDISAAGSGTFYINKGNPLVHAALSASKTVNSGDTFQIDAGNLTITLA